MRESEWSWKDSWDYFDEPIKAKDRWKNNIIVIAETPSLGITDHETIGEGYAVIAPDGSTSVLNKSAVIFKRSKFSAF